MNNSKVKLAIHHWRKARILLLVYSFLLLDQSIGIAQGSSDSYINYTTKDGLPSNQVYKIIEDDLGHLWFLTDKGISKYNGYEFYNYSAADGLSDNVFFDAQKLEDGSIWILGMNGTISIINDKSFRQFEYNDELEKYKMFIASKLVVTATNVCIYYVDAVGKLVLNREGHVLQIPARNLHGLVYAVLDGNNKYYAVTDSAEIDVQDSIIRRVKIRMFGENDGFYLKEQNKYLLMYGKDSLLIREQNMEETIIVKDGLRIGKYDNEKFWVSTKSSGLHIYSYNGILEYTILPDIRVSNVYVSSLGDVWLTSLYHGVYRLIPNHIRYISMGSNVNQLDVGGNNVLYVCQLSGSITKIENYRSSIIFQSSYNTPSSFFLDTSTNDYLYLADRKMYKGIENKVISKCWVSNRYEIIALPKGKIGSCISSGFSIIQNGCENVEYFKRTYSAVLLNNNIVLGSIDGLVLGEETDSGTYDFTELDVFRERVNKVIRFRDHIMIGTNGNGIKLIDTNLTVIRAEIFSDQIASNFINNLVIENDSTFWVCTNQGITEVILNKELQVVAAKTINSEDGLISQDVKDVVQIGDSIYIGTTAGIAVVHDNYFKSATQHENHHLHFVNVLLNDQEVETADLQNLPYQSNRLTFNFTAINLTGSVLHYRYQLRGADQVWNYTTERMALYSNLAPGNYEFIVQVKTKNGIWEDNEQRLGLTIYPPFWLTWWFIFLIIIALIGLIYLFFKFRILSYNRDLIREMLRQILKRIGGKQKSIVVRSGNKNVKLHSDNIKYVKSDGNYLEIYHLDGKTVIRYKIGEFLSLVPDPIEYLQIRRSYIVRIDKIDEIGKDYVVISQHKIKVGSTYLSQLDKIILKP
ncbi:MAG: triple tyrosine motif-containing protein [Putridiphycobacter sp.]|nr:triple tyrosine motif-containing protein [Putridiphycobacter sp.]